MSFDTLLVANRGEIARRVFRTARDMGLRTVAVLVDADADAPYVTEADVAIRLATGYLDGAAIIDAARRAGAGAIHPGYGFLSENPTFAADVAAAGLVFVGPSPHALQQMGDKISAKDLARRAGVPVLPSSEDPADADSVGYPLIVKAAAGGGGKGMRVVSSPSELTESVAAARREAQSGFGDDRVFLERYVAASRHVEIQVLGDTHGSLIHLGERECSIQRRHQKLVEESPSPVVSDIMRSAMGSAALELARAMEYYSVGTVEFLVDDATKEFFFLEVNTRLQVEHPVTEEVTGVDLVREQIRVAQGLRLDLTQGDVTFRGHAIEVRLCAEDPAAGFLPATGTLVAYEPSVTPKVRWESGVRAGSEVTVSFDPMLAKVIAHAPTRGEAAATLALALERLHLGGVSTNRDFLAATLRHPAFVAGDTTTAFIDRHEPSRALVLDEDERAWLDGAVALWWQGRHRADAVVLADLPTGWRNARLPDQSVSLTRSEETVAIRYRSLRDGTFIVNGDTRATLHEWTVDSIDVTIGDRRAHRRITVDGERTYIQCDRGTADYRIEPRFVIPGVEEAAGGLHAPMPGVVMDVRVQPGDEVAKGTTLIVLEAMKMEHHITAPSDGVVTEVYVSVGQQVENGANLLGFDDGSEGEL